MKRISVILGFLNILGGVILLFTPGVTRPEAAFSTVIIGGGVMLIASAALADDDKNPMNWVMMFLGFCLMCAGFLTH